MDVYPNNCKIQIDKYNNGEMIESEILTIDRIQVKGGIKVGITKRIVTGNDA